MPCLVASQTLATGRACAPSACLQWSDDGQVVVATKEALHILTPRVGAALEQRLVSAWGGHLLEQAPELAITKGA